MVTRCIMLSEIIFFCGLDCESGVIATVIRHSTVSSSTLREESGEVQKSLQSLLSIKDTMKLGLDTYMLAVDTAQKQMQASTQLMWLDQTGNVSTIFAQSAQRTPGGKLNLNAFVGIINFDNKASAVTVGGKTPFKMLTEFLLPRGFAPKVVPELDT